MSQDTGRIVVYADADLEDLVPLFLQNRVDDVEKLEQALRDGDLATVQHLGHSMKGAGGGYGFDRITEIGAGLEKAAKAGDAASAAEWVRELAEYLPRVDVVYQ